MLIHRLQRWLKGLKYILAYKSPRFELQHHVVPSALQEWILSTEPGINQPLTPNYSN